jgi:GNAT superfamily N-acetyltransferase
MQAIWLMAVNYNLSWRGVTEEMTLYAVDAIYQDCFEASSVPTEVQYTWWKTQPEGVLALQHGDEVVGGISFWSVSEQVFRGLYDGLLRERDIVLSPIVPAPKGFMYLSEIAIAPPYRGRGHTMLLLEAFLQSVRQRLHIYPSIAVLALGYSEGGMAVLEKINFRQVRTAADTKDGMPLYQLDL